MPGNEDMYLVESRVGAIFCMFLSIIFLGTWPALMNLLERRGRHPQHTYLDDSIASLIIATVIALTVGQIGGSTPDMPNFTSQIYQVSCAIASVLRNIVPEI